MQQFTRNIKTDRKITDRKNWSEEKAFYVDAINELTAECTDMGLLYLIRGILLKSGVGEEATT